MRRFLALLGLTLALASGLTLATPATAALASETDSIPITSMPGCGDIADPTSGGWTGPRLFASRHWYDFTSQFRRPVFLQLKELCAPNNTTYGIRYQINAPNGGTWASNPPSSVQVERASGWQKCYNSSGAVVNVGTGGFNTLTPVESDVWNTYGTITMASHSSCVRLIEATFKVNWRVDDTGAAGTNVSTTVVWSAARSISGEPYTSTFPPELFQICDTLTDGEWALCESVNPSNPASWDDTCGDADNASYYGVDYPGTLTLLANEFDFGTWISWHASCLFNPLGGFDRNNTIADAAEAHPNAAVINGYTTIATAFQMNGSCGVLLDATGTVLDGFRLDSCTWSWAAPWRELLAIVGFAMLAWWALSYIVNSSFAVMNKKIVLPWQDSKGGGI